MKIHFLGTAAAEGWPGLFCRCKHCDRARQLGGKNIRTRSSAIIDDTVKIDFPPDTYYHTIRDQLDLAAIEHLFITHTHSDHLHANDLEMRKPIFAHGVEQALHIYGHDHALQKCRHVVKAQPGLFEFHHLQPYRTVDVDPDTRVTPLLADHDQHETCLLFFIEKNGKSLLYGHDTGWYPAETWEWLEGQTLDGAILDCTNGHLPERRNHSNIKAVLEINETFRQKQILRENGQIFVTHFSHNTGLLHDDLESIFLPHGIVVAFDGLVYQL